MLRTLFLTAALALPALSPAPRAAAQLWGLV